MPSVSTNSRSGGSVALPTDSSAKIDRKCVGVKLWFRVSEYLSVFDNCSPSVDQPGSEVHRREGLEMLSGKRIKPEPIISDVRHFGKTI
jgi:hypothetical protein